MTTSVSTKRSRSSTRCTTPCISKARTQRSPTWSSCKRQKKLGRSTRLATWTSKTITVCAKNSKLRQGTSVSKNQAVSWAEGAPMEMNWRLLATQPTAATNPPQTELKLKSACGASLTTTSRTQEGSLQTKITKTSSESRAQGLFKNSKGTFWNFRSRLRSFWTTITKDASKFSTTSWRKMPCW